MNLSQKLLDNCNKNPNKICLIQNNKKITYKDLLKQVSNYQSYLKSRRDKKR